MLTVSTWFARWRWFARWAEVLGTTPLDGPRLLRWALPLCLLLLAAGWILGLGLGFALPRNPFMLGVCALWGVFGVTRALYADALAAESTKREELIDILASTRSELAEEERRAGVLIERHRLARELHDTLAQSFTGIVLHLEAAEQALSTQRETALRPSERHVERHIDQARASARASLEELRRLLSALRPGLLENTSLGEAVRVLVEQWNDEHRDGGPVATLRLGALGRLHPEVEVTVLRAVQEGLANVQKHARAARVEVTLARTESRIDLRISDDGVGFPAPAPQPLKSPHGYGLLAMRERVQELRGELAFERGEQGGVQVSLWLPVDGEVGLGSHPQESDSEAQEGGAPR